MKSVTNRVLCFLALLLFVANAGAQQRPAAPDDPRIGLKAGFKDAGIAASNMELVKTLPKADGFFDPRSPAGTASAPEPPPGERGGRGGRGGRGANPNGNAPAAAAPATPATPAPPSGLDFANSD